MLKKVEELGCRGIFVTFDAATNGKHELDERVRVEAAIAATPARTPGEQSGKDKKGGGLARFMSCFIDPALVWDDINGCGSQQSYLKGIMMWQDAVLRRNMDWMVSYCGITVIVNWILHFQPYWFF